MLEKQTLDNIEKMKAVLDLEREIVGIKFLFNEEDFEKADAPLVEHSMYYCLMVKQAMSGQALKAKRESFSCKGSVRALGLEAPDAYFTSGQHYSRLGIYEDLTVSKAIVKSMTLCNHLAYGMMIKPLHTFDVKPDVVLMVTTPMEAMRIIQGYTYKYGTTNQLKMSGNQAVCSECTAYPLENNTINLSVLCGGTRAVARWKESEMGIGLPFNQFDAMAEGVIKTMNPEESNTRKKEIENKLKEANITDIPVHYNENYYRKRK